MESVQKLVPHESKKFYDICSGISNATPINTIGEQQLKKLKKLINELKLKNQKNKELLDSELTLLDDFASLIKDSEKAFQFTISKKKSESLRIHVIDSVKKRLEYIEENIFNEDAQEYEETVDKIVYAVHFFKKIIEINEFNYKNIGNDKADRLPQIYFEYSTFINLLIEFNFQESDETKFYEFIKLNLRSLLSREDLTNFISNNV